MWTDESGNLPADLSPAPRGIMTNPHAYVLLLVLGGQPSVYGVFDGEMRAKLYAQACTKDKLDWPTLGNQVAPVGDGYWQVTRAQVNPEVL